ncbi:LacI family DNA-binding transcriptional regulator [Evansella cellulosilytica]|uniref:Transcriptional regulator, LacI family n=1 Tax=Evansella cellulosilytica (strain ATCC 21833 / DSM 2522 / FERM P-1141 / JCM 9156 / N-4) TaxID=649639 RepID=E6TVV5_EVAC2|nr:LacI family DNA-binding transcriptional regulator [Evansella cellulosilytica]ADU28664.1 transcriptional regulator, LacI family [Evansella cellulosilytica DSM 2522]
MATINDVALKAGVSVATVSHVVNKTRYVSPETVKRVEEAINALDEVPNFIQKKRTAKEEYSNRFLVVFASDIFHPFQQSVIEQLNEQLKEQKKTNLIVVQADDNFEILENYAILKPKLCIGKVILLNVPLKKLYKEHSSLKGLPTIVVSENTFQLKGAAASNINFIVSNLYQGTQDATQHLINFGHEKIALVLPESYRNEDQNINDVYKGYKDAFGNKKVPFQKRMIIGKGVNENIDEEIRLLMNDNAPPTAVIVTDEHYLMLVLKYLNSRNLTCPEDLSIICINDLSWFEFFQPGITTVKQNYTLIAKKIIERMTDEKFLKYGLDIEERTVVIGTELKLRSSTGGIARGPFGEKAANVDTIQLSTSEKNKIKENKYTAVISFHYSGAAWMNLHESGIRDIFNELGISLLAVTDAHFDADMQNRQLQGLLSLDPDIFIAIPVDDNKTSDMFKKVAKSRSNLILITNVPKGINPDEYVSCVSVNEWSHGRLAGSGLGSSMRDLGKRKIGMIRFDSDFYATNQRDTAAKQMIIEEYKDLEIVKEVFFKDESDVYDETVKLMRENPDIEGLYVSWEGPATKVISALSAIGRNDVIIGTADLDYELALNIAENGNVKKVSTQLPYEQGQALALVAANTLLNKAVPKFIGVEPVEVTTDNLIKMWKKVFKEDAPEEIANAIKQNIQT